VRGDTRGGRTSFARLVTKAGSAGFALPAALLAMLLIAALIAGAFGAVTEETRLAATAAARQHALLGAESAIEIVITTQSAWSGDSISVGESRSQQVDGVEVPVVVYVTRLDSSIYWLVADAGSPALNSGIARRIGVLVRARNGPAGSMIIDRIPERAWLELF
jgi:type II secretory pathway pseudopilin PulG